MTSSSKRKGDKFEHLVRAHCEASGIHTERTRAGYARDHGDLHLAATPAGVPVIGQAKAEARYDLPGYVRDTAQQRDAAGARHGFAVVKRKGVTAPGQQFVVLELDWYLALLREAGYGAEPSDHETGPQIVQTVADHPDPPTPPREPASGEHSRLSGPSTPDRTTSPTAPRRQQP